MLRFWTVLFAITTATPGYGRAPEPTNAGLAEQAMPSVVAFSVWKIATALTRREAPRRVKVFGSGFVIDSSGIIVTNKHILEGALDIMVILNDGTRVHGMRLATAALIDLALVKVSAGKPLPALKWGDSHLLRLGDPVLAVGNPMGIGTSVSAGVISGLNRNLLDTPFDEYIQTDAAINRGNSGGPLINRDGEVVGINTALYNDDPRGGSIGIGFALPSAEARLVIDRLLLQSHPQPGWLGLKLQDITAHLADALGLPTPEGSIITDVDPTGPAGRAALKPGDVLQGIDGTSPSDSRAFMRRVAMLPAGQPVTLLVWRDGKILQVVINTAQWPGPESDHTAATSTEALMRRPPDWGLTLKPISRATQQSFNLDRKAKGVLIAAVEVGCEAEESGLEAGDVIEEVQNSPVNTPADVLLGLRSAYEHRRPFAALLVDGKRGKRWVTLSVWDVLR